MPITHDGEFEQAELSADFAGGKLASKLAGRLAVSKADGNRSAYLSLKH